MTAEHDAKKRRCPALGHEVAFSYCRAPGSETPCGKIFDCWWETFDVSAFIAAHYDTEAVKKITAPPPPKTGSLLDLIEQARKRIDGDERE